MARRKAESGPSDQDKAARHERANRILDAAALLILRWGYNKTNVEDIAKQAGVGKGTIYLHWKTRDDLFRTLIHREELEMAAEFRQCISEDPEGATLHGIYKHYTVGIMKRPLLKAYFLRDAEALGKYTEAEQGTAPFVARVAGFKTYFEFLSQRGLVRTDLTLKEFVYVLSAILMGFYTVKPLLPDEFLLSDDEIAERIADTVHHTLEISRPLSADELREMSRVFLEYLDHGITLYQSQFQQEMG